MERLLPVNLVRRYIGLGIGRFVGQDPPALRLAGWKNLELLGQPAPPVQRRR